MFQGNPSNLKPFKKGHKKVGGRKKGVRNKVPGFVKKAMVDAAARIGLDGHGFAGLVGFVIRVGILDPQALMRSLIRLLSAELRSKPTVQYMMDPSKLTDEEVATYLRFEEKCRRPPPREKKTSQIDIDVMHRKVQELIQQAQSKPSPRKRTVGEPSLSAFWRRS